MFSEADQPSQLFQYYLLDTEGFEPNVFTTIFPGVNDQVQFTTTGGNCGLTTIGAVRVVLEPKPGLPTDPNNPRAFNDVFTDISPLFVINNESGWYEGWMIHDLVVPATAAPRADGHAQFAAITAQDAKELQEKGRHHNIAGAILTVDGRSSSASSLGLCQITRIRATCAMGAICAYEALDPSISINEHGPMRIRGLTHTFALGKAFSNQLTKASRSPQHA